MKLIEADKVEQAIKDYWKAQVDKLPTPYSTEEFEKFSNRAAMCLEHNHELLKAIDELPPAEPDTTTHDSIPAETGKNDGDGTSGDCISRTQAIYVASGYCHPANVATELAKLPSIQPDIIRCKDCEFWTKQENSIQGRCALHKMYPSGNWYCGTARRRGEQS